MQRSAKVINIFSRKEVKRAPYGAENAQDVMQYLMQYRNPRTGKPITSSEYQIINELLYMLENNSGTAREDVFERGA